MNLSNLLMLVAVILAAVEVLRSEGKSLLAWAVLLLGLALLVASGLVPIR